MVSIVEILLGVSVMDLRQTEWFPKISRATGDQGTHASGEEQSEVQAASLRPQGTQDNQPVQADEEPPIKRLDGEVKRLQETPYAGGTYCEVWVGQWEKQGEEKDSGVEIEKVSPSLTTSILLTGLFVGCLESISNFTPEGA